MPKANSKATVLTDRGVRALKAEKGERLEYWDETCRGLCLRVSEGGKRWVYRYRRPDGSQPRMTLGDYVRPEDAGDNPRALTVAGARLKARRLRIEIDDGADPAGAKLAAKTAAAAQPIRTLDDLATTFFDASAAGHYRPGKTNAPKRERTIASERSIYRCHLEKAIGKVRVEDVSRDAVNKILRALQKEGQTTTANRVRGLLQTIYNFANYEGRTDVNPTRGIRPFKENKRLRVLTDKEFSAVWAALKDPTGLRLPPKEGETTGAPVYAGRAVRIALQLAFLTIQRRGEVAGMLRSELDLERGLWTISADRTKNGKMHVVPLSPTAADLIREAIAIGDASARGAAKGGAFAPPLHVFPGRRNPRKPDVRKSIDPGALTHVFCDIRDSLRIKDAIVHDARRLGATLICGERIGFAPYVAGLVMNHSAELGGAAAVTLEHYAHHDRTPDKKRALLALERLLLTIAGEIAPADTVVSIHAGAAA